MVIEDLKQIHNAQAYQQLNTKDWEEINKFEEQLQAQYSVYIVPEFYQYKNNQGLIAIYKHEDQEVAKIQLVADFKQ